jgi:hypothetical protein
MKIQQLSELKVLMQRYIFGSKIATTFNPYSRAVFDKLRRCHTIGMGVHQYRCDDGSCGHVHHQYHSCGDRHCPHCGGSRRDAWIEDRMSELLPIKYYHVVFTLPAELRSLVMGNRKKMFDLIFESAHYTLLKLGRDPKWLGAQLGIISILHTHGQELTFHPHIHCIVSGGGVTEAGKWRTNKRDADSFLFPRRVMEKIYKAYFLKRTMEMLGDGDLSIEGLDVNSAIDTVKYKKWNVYTKAPFAGPSQIIEYLGRYTHKVAITAHRIKEITQTDITFKYKDYADKNTVKEMTLSHEEFARRFEQHVLPRRYVKIRHCGFLSHRNKGARLRDLHKQMSLPPPMPKVTISTALRVMLKTGVDINICPICKRGRMKHEQSLIMYNGALRDVATLRNRGSPDIKSSR